MEETLFSDIPITSSVAADVIDVAEELSTKTEYNEEGFNDLSLKMDSVVLPESTTESGSPGSVDVTITNVGDTTVDGTIDINLFVSSDKKINTGVLPLTGNEVQDGLFSTLEDADITGLKPGDSNTVTIKFDDITSFIRPDSQFIIAEIDGDSLGSGQDVVEENNSDYILVSFPGTEQMDISSDEMFI